MSEQTLSTVKKIKGAVRQLVDCIDLLWMLEINKMKGTPATQNIDEDSKKLQSVVKSMQDKLTDMVGGFRTDARLAAGGAAAGGEPMDVGHFDKEKAEAAALANFDSIPFNMNPFF